ncbi:MAG: hypothetical protein M1269_13665 [Chloroflexi bacterium]|nr:hypothetical protein [Chloroflexota bacterium]
MSKNKKQVSKSEGTGKAPGAGKSPGRGRDVLLVFILWLLLPLTALLSVILGDGVPAIYGYISPALMSIGTFVASVIMKILTALGGRDMSSRFWIEFSGPLFALLVPAILTFWYGSKTRWFSLAAIFLACLGIEMMIQGFIISGDTMPPFKMIKSATYWDFPLYYLSLSSYRGEIGMFIGELGTSFMMMGTFASIWEMGKEIKGNPSPNFYSSLIIGIWAALFLAVIKWRPYQAGLLLGLWLVPRIGSFTAGKKPAKKTAPRAEKSTSEN